LTENTKNGMEWDDHSLTKSGMERMERNENRTVVKKEREQNDLDEGPFSRTERNDLQKCQNVPSPMGTLVVWASMK